VHGGIVCQEHDMQCKPVLMPHDDCDSQFRVCFARFVRNAWETALISLERHQHHRQHEGWL